MLNPEQITTATVEANLMMYAEIVASGNASNSDYENLMLYASELVRRESTKQNPSQ